MLLEVKNLKTYFQTEEGIAKAVDGIDFSVEKGEIIGFVGESGCGKSVTALSIIKLLQEPQGKIIEGEILFNGTDLVQLSEKEMQKVRGNKIGMVFQEPMTSLNPAYTCGNQISEVLILHKGLSKKDALNKTIQLLKKVGIASPEQRFSEYPHQLSGGMRQRVMIAMALACEPDLLIADEPTTALDVTVQAQILELIKSLQSENNMGVILVTHDLGVVAETADRIAVMYASKIAEQGTVTEIFDNPKHPYTKALLASMPDIKEKKKRLNTIEGTVPSSTEYPSGCHFCTRCNIAEKKCSNEEPPFVKLSETHNAYCWKIN